MNKRCTTKSILILSLILFSFTGKAQEISFEENLLSKLSIRNGIPFFQDSSDFETVYEQLAQLELEHSPSDPLILEQDCEAATPALKAFERNYEFQSLRAKQDQLECEELRRGKTPEQLSQPLINDPILAALFNSDGQLWIGENIFYIKSDKRFYLINNGDREAIKAIDDGDWYGNDNIELFMGGGESLADFEYEKINGNQFQFTFTGQVTPQESVLWDFGDGTTAEGLSQSHDFGTEANSATVCVKVVKYSSGSPVTIDELCKTIQLKNGPDLSCVLFIKKNKGDNGNICFNLWGLKANQVETVSWDFGDGNSSTELKPCHQYSCNKIHLVKAHYTLSSGCKFTTYTLVNVNSFQCCDHLASNKGSILYQEDKMVKYHLFQIPLPIIGRTVISSRHYKKKGNRFVRRPANITNSIHGKVFTSDNEACRCMIPQTMNEVETKYKSWLVTTYKVGSYFQASADEPWYAKVYINGSLILSKTVNTNCN